MFLELLIRCQICILDNQNYISILKIKDNLIFKNFRMNSIVYFLKYLIFKTNNFNKI
jgi:hypothetical protein